MATDEKLTIKQILREASEKLHAVRPQPSGPEIEAALATLKASLTPATPEEEPPTLDKALSEIKEATSKVDPAPKTTADLRPNFKAAEPPAEKSKPVAKAATA